MTSLFKKKKQITGDTTPELETAPESAKRLEDYEQSFPVQLQLFQYLQPDEKRYSNTIELYDFMPKYHWERRSELTASF